MQEENELRVGDDVWNRVVQILQEAMILGIDITDLLRQVRVVQDGDHVSLAASYIKQTSDWHDKLLAEAETIQAGKSTPTSFVIDGDNKKLN